MILAGDIGGTKVNLACYDRVSGMLQQVEQETFPSKGYTSLGQIVTEFIEGKDWDIVRACFGIAGPVIHGVCHTTNLPWVVEVKALSEQLGGIPTLLINDLEANASGIKVLGPHELCTLQPGEKGAVGNMALVSAGTGLGVAGLYYVGMDHRPFACEGGHVDFSPNSDLDVEFYHFLKEKFGHVSWERILSGQGQVNIYEFLRKRSGEKEPCWLGEEFVSKDPAAVITQTGLAKKDPVCEQAVDLFVRYYGTQAGNVALTIMATGGLYIGGGIAPRILSKLKEPAFIDAFRTKGRFSSLLEKIPVRVILNPKTALIGAAYRASMT
jgi:glucokinase